jgi:hypothetical protein
MLRPLTFGQVLDVGFKITFRHLGQLLLTVAVVVIPVQIIAVLVQLSAFPAAFDPTAQQQTFSGGGQQAPQVDTDQLVVGVVGSLVAALFTVVATLLATAACFKAVSDAYLGERPHWRSSLRFALARTGPVLWVGFLVFGTVFMAALIMGVSIALGPLAILVIPLALVLLVYVQTRWTVAIPALLVEDVRGTRAIGRSWRLVENRFWFTLGINVMALLIAFLAGLVLGVIAAVPVLLDPSNILLNAAAQTVVGIISTILTTPIIAAFTIVLYFDLRVRKEGFDLELLARRIGAAPPAPAPAAGHPHPAGSQPPPPASPGGPPPPPGPPDAPERPDRGPTGG